MKNGWMRDSLFIVLAICGLVQIGLGVRSMVRSRTWSVISGARQATHAPATNAAVAVSNNCVNGCG